MQREAGPQPAAAAIDPGERRVQRCRSGSTTLGPVAPEIAGDAVEHGDAAALNQDKPRRGKRGEGKAEQHRRRRPRLRLQLDEPCKAERGVGELRDEFERHVDDRARGGNGPRDAGQRQRAGAQHIAADLRQRQRLRARIANQPGPYRNPRMDPGQQGAPRQAHRRGQDEMDRQDRDEAGGADREQRAHHRAGPEIADEHRHRRHPGNGGEDRQRFHPERAALVRRRSRRNRRKKRISRGTTCGRSRRGS